MQGDSKMTMGAPLTGVAFFLVAVASFLIGGDAASIDDPANEIVAHYVDNQNAIWAGALVSIAAAALLVFFGAHLRDVLRAAAPGDEMLSLAAFIGLVIVAAGIALDATIAFALTETAGDVDPVAVQALHAFLENQYGLVQLGCITFLWGTGLAVLRTGALPRRLGWVMVTLGVIGLTPVGFFAALGSALLVPAISIVLATRARQGAGAVAITAAATSR